MKFLWVYFQKHLGYHQFYLQFLNNFSHSSSEITEMSCFVVISVLKPSFQLYVNTNIYLLSSKQRSSGNVMVFLVAFKLSSVKWWIWHLTLHQQLCFSINQQGFFVCPLLHRFSLSLNQSLRVSFPEELSWIKQMYEMEGEDIQKLY